MYALIQCKRVSNPSNTLVDVESVQFVEDIQNAEFNAPTVGDVGTAIVELSPTVKEDAVIIGKLADNPTRFKVLMKSGSTGGWYYGYGAIDRNRMTIPVSTEAFERKLNTVDYSKGSPSLLRSKEITFFKNI